MLPVDKARDLEILRDEDVVGLKIGMAENRKVELQACGSKVRCKLKIFQQ